MVSPNGTKFAQNVTIDEAIIAQIDPFDGLIPDDEDFGGYDVTQFYRKSCIVVMPKNKEFGFLQDCAISGTLSVDH